MRPSTAFLVILPLVLVVTAFVLATSGRAGAADPLVDGMFWDEHVAAYVRRSVAGTYVDTLDGEQQAEAFYRAMAAYVRLDPYCAFYDPREYRQW
jgi:hypothetical protein